MQEDKPQRRMATPQSHFRLMDLPGEIRNQIYQHLLCSFNYKYGPDGLPNELERMLQQKPKPNGVYHAKHSIDTNILRSSRTVHREAYDVMVKTNRFIRIQSSSYSFARYLVWSQLPVVTMDRQHASQFNGYVLQMRLEDLSQMNEHDLFDFVILGQDWDGFCRSFSKMIRGPERLWFHLDANITAGSDMSDFRAAVDDHFITKSRTEVLRSFSENIRGVEKVSLDDQLTSRSAQEIESQVKLMPWIDSPGWYSSIEAQCRVAEDLQAQNKWVAASFIWSAILVEMRPSNIPNSPELLSRMNGLMFTSCYNTAVCCLHCLNTAPQSLPISYYQELGEYGLDKLKAMQINHCEGFVRARYFLTFAHITRLLGTRVPQYATQQFATTVGRLLQYARSLDDSNLGITDEIERWTKWSRSILHPEDDV